MPVTTVFTDMEKIMLAPVESFIDSGVNGLSGYLTGPLTVATTIYIVLYGYLVLKGTIQEPLMDFVFKCMKITIIVMLATKAGEYNTYVKSLFFESLPNEIGAALNVSETGINGFDALIDKALAAASTLWANAGMGPGIVFDAIICIVIIIIATLVAVIGFIVGFYAKIALSLVLALGPVFIALALFNGTRRFTEGWIGQLANYTILQILSVAVGTLIVQSLLTMIDKASSLNEAMTAMVTFVSIALCAAYIFYQLPMIASALAAGGAMLTFGGGRSRVGGSPDGGGGDAGGANGATPDGQSKPRATSNRQYLAQKMKAAAGRGAYWAGRGAGKMRSHINS
ncbi:type IV secretion system protein VirB6 [Ochrobactrum anthropi]|uniref:type IV secretion system protein n=1 Tax=Brucella anthropi TaxID=529 RepID=UPI0015F796D0|nr:type IV secretion system protein [Brucella anthropi]MBA8862729.1 type IV secretion system protein VirB6 [Brucella anthropi]